MTEFTVKSVTEGIDAIGEGVVRVCRDGEQHLLATVEVGGDATLVGDGDDAGQPGGGTGDYEGPRPDCRDADTRAPGRLRIPAHSVCTLEFEDQRPWYDWLLDTLCTLGLLAPTFGAAKAVPTGTTVPVTAVGACVTTLGTDPNATAARTTILATVRPTGGATSPLRRRPESRSHIEPPITATTSARPTQEIQTSR